MNETVMLWLMLHGFRLKLYTVSAFNRKAIMSMDLKNKYSFVGLKKVVFKPLNIFEKIINTLKALFPILIVLF